jgi:hypothetical protein
MRRNLSNRYQYVLSAKACMLSNMEYKMSVTASIVTLL